MRVMAMRATQSRKIVATTPPTCCADHQDDGVYLVVMMVMMMMMVVMVMMMKLHPVGRGQTSKFIINCVSELIFMPP